MNIGLLFLLDLYEGYMFVMVRSPGLLAMCLQKILNSMGDLYA